MSCSIAFLFSFYFRLIYWSNLFGQFYLEIIVSQSTNSQASSILLKNFLILTQPIFLFINSLFNHPVSVSPPSFFQIFFPLYLQNTSGILPAFGSCSFLCMLWVPIGQSWRRQFTLQRYSSCCIPSSIHTVLSPSPASTWDASNEEDNQEKALWVSWVTSSQAVLEHVGLNLSDVFAMQVQLIWYLHSGCQERSIARAGAAAQGPRTHRSWRHENCHSTSQLLHNYFILGKL